MSHKIPLRPLGNAIVSMIDSALGSQLGLQTKQYGGMRHLAAPDDFDVELNALLVLGKWKAMEPGPIGGAANITFHFDVLYIMRAPDDTTDLQETADEIVADRVAQIGALFWENEWQVPINEPGLGITEARAAEGDPHDPLLEYFRTVQYRMVSGLLTVEVDAILSPT